jgi:tetratricopeptide (TPR) repeat protein
MSQTAANNTPKKRLAKISFRKKLLFAAVATLSFFVVCECLFAAIDWLRPASEGQAIDQDPFVGFSRSLPLFERIRRPNGETVFRTHPAKLVWFNDQTFPVEKAPGTVRVVCLGGSTTYGRPFADPTSFAGWLRELLPLADPRRRWEVINAGGVSYASYRVARLMEELSQYDVDVFVLYTGQNEFLERRTYGDVIETPAWQLRVSEWLMHSHLGRRIDSLIDNAMQSAVTVKNRTRLPGEVDEMLNHTIGPTQYERDPDWYRGVHRHFEFNLNRIKQISDSVGAELLVIHPASNLRDCSPFKAQFDDSISATRRDSLNIKLQQARQAIESGNNPAAVDLLSELHELDNRHAGVCFWLGRALLDNGDAEAAYREFQDAIDHDICPLRATASLKAILRRFVAEHDLPSVDFEQLAEQYALARLGHRCVGSEAFLDHVHPTVDLHRELALGLLTELRRRKWIATLPSDAEVAAVSRRVEGRLDLATQGIAFRNLAKVMHWAGKFTDALRSARDAIRLMPEDLESRYLVADCLTKLGKQNEAVRQYERLFEIGSYPRALFPFGVLLAEVGRDDAAKTYLLEAILQSEGTPQASAYEALGRLHAKLGEDELAEECFRAASSLREHGPNSR